MSELVKTGDSGRIQNYSEILQWNHEKSEFYLSSEEIKKDLEKNELKKIEKSRTLLNELIDKEIRNGNDLRDSSDIIKISRLAFLKIKTEDDDLKIDHYAYLLVNLIFNAKIGFEDCRFYFEKLSNFSFRKLIIIEIANQNFTFAKEFKEESMLYQPEKVPIPNPLIREFLEVIVDGYITYNTTPSDNLIYIEIKLLDIGKSIWGLCRLDLISSDKITEVRKILFNYLEKEIKNE